jgi:hypothetical protein
MERLSRQRARQNFSTQGGRGRYMLAVYVTPTPLRSFYIEKAMRAGGMIVLSKSAGGVCIRYREAAT